MKFLVAPSSKGNTLMSCIQTARMAACGLQIGRSIAACGYQTGRSIAACGYQTGVM